MTVHANKLSLSLSLSLSLLLICWLPVRQEQPNQTILCMTARKEHDMVSSLVTHNHVPLNKRHIFFLNPAHSLPTTTWYCPLQHRSPPINAALKLHSRHQPPQQQQQQQQQEAKTVQDIIKGEAGEEVTC